MAWASTKIEMANLIKRQDVDEDDFGEMYVKSNRQGKLVSDWAVDWIKVEDLVSGTK
ncbi:hypothetical protein FB479_102150 [Brevibacillus sp. AG162]|uniref:hypothetical protein n=1 Tax=Brevibacillus sp. AG162 TaxID=2572910 RepID=UPI00116CD5FE|nr:hypothetical protein [Brevibacillus sp. AG162]TQK73521.1 hypothetical protein FB479_102150 [Brevibacillus sp. AG162]